MKEPPTDASAAGRRVSGGSIVLDRISFVCFTLLVLGCTVVSGDLESAEITADDLLVGAPFGIVPGAAELVDDQEVLAVNDEMREFVETHVERRAGDYIRLHQLLLAIISKGTFGLQYDETTRTASETFRLRKGNCLSFSNMFIALARAADLDAQFQEVDIPPDWTYRNDAFVLNRHVNVYVDLGRAGHHAVDFNMEDFRTGYDRRTISDTRALAHYFNNMGVESMQGGDAASALAYFRRAIVENDRRFSPAWANLGILYLREGYPKYAEAAFLQALDEDGDNFVANLVGLYEQSGDLKRAAVFQKRVVRHRNQNPYYRYQLARKAFLAQDYDAAISHLKYAIRKRDQEDQFHFLLGLSYLQKGDEGAARRSLARAEELAATDALKRSYSNKIEMLLSASN